MTDKATKEWEQTQMDCAKAWANLDIAVEMVEANKAELTFAQYKQVQDKIDEQQKLIQDTLMQGLAAYRLATGNMDIPKPDITKL
jgi:hypothetical protein